MHARTNRLIHESSPYLLQHAHNPVDWRPWGEEALALARAENKLMLVSIGYSSCHWCHVMERESFMAPDLAALMNTHFICIKVDREERPDIDQVYMAAVQLMTGRGGWPLNCFTLPDGRPVHGGTYFPPAQWEQVLQQLAAAWADEPERVMEHAARLHAGLEQSGGVPLNEADPAFDRKVAGRMAARFAKDFDAERGGAGQAPKFPLPGNYLFLLRYAITAGDAGIAKHVRLTLDRMAQGGIFDQAGGGFARYSTDAAWKVPHFEKMLYDNAQLIALYSQAYRAFGHAAYRDVAERTIAWAFREMRAPEGGFHSALDADSEGEEGRYYVWTAEELQAALGEDAGFARDYYRAEQEGLWEKGRNILLRTMDDQAFATRHGLELKELIDRRDRVNAKLLAAREQRERPGLDDKVLTSWNAMMVSGLCEAFTAFGDQACLAQAQETMRLLLAQCRRSDGGLWHSWKNGKASVNGYLEDYSFTIEALNALYQATFEEAWLQHARTLAEYALAHFLDPASGMCWFTSKLDPPLITRRMEIHDNVMPASSSSLAKGLFMLGNLFDDERMRGISLRQLHNVLGNMAEYPSAFANWGLLLMDQVFPRHEVAITGEDALAIKRGFDAHYLPGVLFMGTQAESSLPLLAGKPVAGQGTIFVCQDKACQLPVHAVEEALKQIR